MLPAHPASDTTPVSPLPPLLFPSLPPHLRTLAFIDLETTGLDASRHEVLEVAILRVDARSLKVLAEYEARVQPTRLADAHPEALAVCGYSDEEWRDALPLREVLATVTPLLAGTLVAGHNTSFDWGFLVEGYRSTELPLPSVDYHRLDTASLAWPLLATGEVESLSLNALAKHFGLHRPTPHRAMADARCALEVARRLAVRMSRGGHMERLLEESGGVS
ncbi:3'-5' exonuclease [Stigmatella aurantiaca]|uniref:DNA polymerase III PolC-type, putative n=1 Tax=Stigmatella aurantiaca (strain DW4/3-1) TaxID=378806 RepID=Q090A6_STIAD|nr:3'-5' exonuclease [Stigmatella aurantiaca]ADO70347.1 Exonuclease [Stigmatella aurantiaca DW4/3-1]EAU66061.1 DNA polymerase III PolC-type, putative [Stigmatella aurantiaca DW4/3-1]